MCRFFLNKNKGYFSFLFVFSAYILLFASLTAIKSSAQSMTLVSFWLKVEFFFHFFLSKNDPAVVRGQGCHWMGKFELHLFS